MRPTHRRLGAFLLCSLLAAACSSSFSEPEPQVQQIATLEIEAPDTATYTTLGVGGTVQLTARALDDSGRPVTGPDLTWSSSNPAAATVDQTGLVRGVGEGPAKISVTETGGTSELPSASKAVVVGTPGSGVSLECEQVPDGGADAIAALRERMASLWFEHPHVTFEAVSGALSFNPEPWREGKFCLFPHYLESRADGDLYAIASDLVMSFPGGGYFLSFEANAPAWEGGGVVQMAITFTDGSSDHRVIFGEPRVVTDDGQRHGTLATADLTDETRAIQSVHVSPLGRDTRPYYGNLRFFSRGSQSAAPARKSSPQGSLH